MIFIAEIGMNHNGNFGLLHELIRRAKEADADIAKFQLGWRWGEGEINQITPEVIQDILSQEITVMDQRLKDGRGILEDMGESCPAFGMIGTLAGLIAMLANLSDPDAIGSGMALALITTMYGAIFANLMLIPMKGKLEDKDKEEVLVKEIMIEGILSIQSGDNPRILEAKLISFLPPSRREAILAESNAD